MIYQIIWKDSFATQAQHNVKKWTINENLHTSSESESHSIARSLGYNWRFLAKECPIVEDVIGLFRKPNSTGGVATMPYKTAIMAHLDGLDDYSVKVCACNNVYRVTDGSIRRLNNDWRGIKSCPTFASEESKGRRP